MKADDAVPVLSRVMRGYVGSRSLAAKALGQIGDPSAAPALIEALGVQSRSLQLAALKSLGQLQYQEALPAVREFLDAIDPRLRRTAALTLGALGDERAVSALLEIARSDESPLVRPAAVEALGMVGDEDVLDQLLPFVDDSNAYLRAALAHALSSLDGDTPEVRSALETLSDDKVRHVSIAAQRALANCAALPEDSDQEDEKSCPEPDKKHLSWLRRFLGRD
jgi:HEAT repeat protein